MTTGFLILTVLFIIVSAIMILIILVQRPQGGGLAGAFGGAGGGSTDTVFGGRVGDALTFMTVCAFGAYVLLAVGLNIMDPSPKPQAVVTPAAATQPATAPQPADAGAGLGGTTQPATDAGSTPPAIDAAIDPVVPPLSTNEAEGERPKPDDAPPTTAPVAGN